MDSGESGREFRSAGGWGLGHRATLVEAAPTLVRHWIDGHSIIRPDSTLDRDSDLTPASGRSAHSRAGQARSPGHAAGVPGFLENRDAFTAGTDVEAEELSAFFLACEEPTPVLARDLVTLCQHGGLLRNALPTELRGLGARIEGRLRYWPREHRGQRIRRLPARRGGRERPRPNAGLLSPQARDVTPWRAYTRVHAEGMSAR